MSLHTYHFLGPLNLFEKMLAYQILMDSVENSNMYLIYLWNFYSYYHSTNMRWEIKESSTEECNFKNFPDLFMTHNKCLEFFYKYKEKRTRKRTQVYISLFHSQERITHEKCWDWQILRFNHSSYYTFVSRSTISLMKFLLSQKNNKMSK